MLKDGWLYTGDIGEVDADGYVRITDRKKDLIKTSGGKYIAPQNLENELKGDPLISQAVVHGDQRKYVTALITLSIENARAWAAEQGLAEDEPLHANPKVKARIQQAVDALNAKQASYSSIKKFVILETDFTQDRGELTPTLKVKRKVVTERYRKLLDGMYTE
jgi:long-chain acyl-CoA synthetase